MSLRPKKPASPYKVLYWMGAALLVLAVGITALVIYSNRNRQVADPERTLLWMYDANDPTAPAVATIIEESRSRSRLVAVPFVAPEAAQKAFASGDAKGAQESVATLVGRKIHHRVFLPYSVTATLIDAAGGINVGGQRLNGTKAMDLVRASGDQAAVRSAQVLMALAKSASANGVNMGVSDGLKLAQQMNTDLDLMGIPDVLKRWNSYQAPQVTPPTGGEPGAAQSLLLPDPSTSQK